MRKRSSSSIRDAAEWRCATMYAKATAQASSMTESITIAAIILQNYEEIASYESRDCEDYDCNVSETVKDGGHEVADTGFIVGVGIIVESVGYD